MGKWDKLQEKILAQNKNLRFEELDKALIKIGYTRNPPSGSHYTYSKKGKMPITIVRESPMNKAYIHMVRDAVAKNESEGK